MVASKSKVGKVSKDKPPELPKPSDPDFEWVDRPELVQLEFDAMVERRVELKRVVDEAEKELAELNPQIEAALVLVDATKVGIGNHVVHRIKGQTAGKVNTRKLVERGVDPDLVADCTDPGREYWYIQVKPRGKG
jgi:hypothetical protein